MRKFIEAFMQENSLDYTEAADLYKVFLEELAENLNDLKAAVEAANIESAGRLAHNIKGITGSYKMNEAYKTAAALNEQLKAANTGNLRGMADRLYSQAAQGRKEIIEYFNII